MPFPLVAKDEGDVFLNLRPFLLVLLAGEGKDGEADGDDVLDLHELLLRGHVEASLLLNGVVGVPLHQFLVDLGLPLLVDPRVGVHLVVLLEDLLVVELLVDHVRHAVPEVDEVANYDELEAVLIELLVQQLLLVRPIEDQDGRLFEVQLVVVADIVLVQLVDQVLLIQELPHSMQLLISPHHSDVVVGQLCLAVRLYAQLLPLPEVTHRVVLLLQPLDPIPQLLQRRPLVEHQDMMGDEIEPRDWINVEDFGRAKDLFMFEVIQLKFNYELFLYEPNEGFVESSHFLILVNVLLVDAVGSFVERDIAVIGLVEGVVIVAADHNIDYYCY